MNVLLQAGGVGGDGEPLGLAYAVAAYVVIFVAFFGYLGYLHLSARRLRRSLEDLEKRLPDDGSHAEG